MVVQFAQPAPFTSTIWVAGVRPEVVRKSTPLSAVTSVIANARGARPEALAASGARARITATARGRAEKELRLPPPVCGALLGRGHLLEECEQAIGLRLVAQVVLDAAEDAP